MVAPARHLDASHKQASDTVKKTHTCPLLIAKKNAYRRFSLYTQFSYH